MSSRESKAVIDRYARALSKTTQSAGQPEAESAVRSLLEDELASYFDWPSQDRAAIKVGVRVLTELKLQGWRIQVMSQEIQLLRPEEFAEGSLREKERIRRQELLKRDEQLASPSVQRFVREMERKRIFGEEFVSIFSLFRDGRSLAERLRQIQGLPAEERVEKFTEVIDPYLVFFSEGDRCPHTGLRLKDIWRYFRHTWTSKYSSVPGRTMAFLVRDRAADKHPVLGIGALSSPVVQIESRDVAIGWHPKTLLADFLASPSRKKGRWLRETVDAAINELYRQDLLEGEGSAESLSMAELLSPTQEVVQRLRNLGRNEREFHERFDTQAEHKVNPSLVSEEQWAAFARSHLFKSKRAYALADLLEARAVFDQHLSDPPEAEEVQALARSRAGKRSILKVARKAKADRVGIAMADISVCGAIPPYGPILGGKLVSMLAASPEVVAAYKRRYKGAVSEIASKMAGKPIRRPAELVFLSTTSLYGNSSQYNRIRVPGDRLGGEPESELRYIPFIQAGEAPGGPRKAGKTTGIGSSQFGRETVLAIDALVKQVYGREQVRYIFGEGASPKMRKLRLGLTTAGFTADVMLHHRRRQVFGVPLISNLRDYLLGMVKSPKYICRVTGPEASAAIAAWWLERWFTKRIESEEVLSAVERHTLTAPVRHGARVQLPPEDSDQLLLFGDL